MPGTRKRQLNVGSLFKKMPRLTLGCTLLRGEATVVCFDSQGHGTRCALTVDGDHSETFRVIRPDVTSEMKASHDDHVKAVEHGAEGIAFLLMRRVTPYTVVRQMRRGTAADWWLAHRGALLQEAARLECSGTLEGGASELATRTRQKIERARNAKPTLPTYVCVTSFRHARAKVVLL